jgi:hypothetical protein
MLIGVLSDTHDNLPKIAAAGELFAERGVELILHAGDYVAPFALRALLAAGIPLVGVFGNNDGERAGLKKQCPTLYESPHRLEAAGRAVVLAHDPAELAGAGQADLVVHGHTHEPGVRRDGALVLNPGEAGGWLSGRCTAAIVDLETMHVEIVELGPQETVEL